MKKQTPAQVFFIKIYEIFKNICFAEHLETTAIENDWRCCKVKPRPNPRGIEKINLNFYFHAFFWWK